MTQQRKKPETRPMELHVRIALDERQMELHVRIALDERQYDTLIGLLKTIGKLLVESIDDPKKLTALTQELRQSETALNQAVAQNEPQP